MPTTTGLFFDRLHDTADGEAEKTFTLNLKQGTLNTQTKKLTLALSLVIDDVSFATSVDPDNLSGEQALFEAVSTSDAISKIAIENCFFKDAGGSAFFQVKFLVAGGKVGGPGAFFAKKTKKKKAVPKKKPAPKRKVGYTKKK